MSKGHRLLPGHHWIICLLCCLMLTACSGGSSKSGSSGSGSYSGATWTVKRGDTLYRVSRATGMSVRELASLNGLRSPYTIEVGQKLKVKGSGSSAKKTTTTSSSRTATAKSSSSSSRAIVPAVSLPPVGSRCWRWPATGNIVMPYSTSQGGNKGIDIAGTRGQPIYAAGAGTVVYAGNQLRGYGNLIMIKHDEQYITAYGHNDTLLVTNGQKVTAGQKIATMGSTGADSVRLHFQIRYKANAIDPQRYLPAQGKSCS